MSYHEATELLSKHTGVVELTDGDARVAVCPEYQGRVMTSTCGGPAGPSFGFVNRRFIEAGKCDPRFNNYGGEDRLWLSPEGGQFSLWFKPDAEQNLDNWYTPPAFNEGAWEVISGSDEKSCRMTTAMGFQNASATNFKLDVAREVRLFGADDMKNLFGSSVADTLGRDGVKTVGYETTNKITNRGDDMTKEKGLVSIWILGMLCAGEETVVVVPYKPGDEAKLGPVIKSDYFGPVPPDRLKVTPEAVLFSADGHFRSKIGTSQRRARDVLGAIDFQAGVLTIVQFTMPDDPSKHNYMNNMWELPQARPYTGDVANSYNDGPNKSGEQLGAFYEIESLSPAVALKTGKSLVHSHCTVHIQADPPALRQLAKEILGVDLESVRGALPRLIEAH